MKTMDYKPERYVLVSRLLSSAVRIWADVVDVKVERTLG